MEQLMGRGLLLRILALEAVVFVLAAVLLPILVFQLARASAVLYLALTFALVLVLSGVLIFSRIVRPLGRLIEAAERATAPADELLPEEGSADEVGRLTRALNRMVRRLAERQRALEAHVAELEAKRRALETAHEALLRSERLASVGRLAAGVAHEVGNPLATIQGFLSLARSETVSAALRADYLGRVEAEVDRIHRLLRDLMDYARPPAQSLGPLDPRRPVEAALQLLAPQPRFREIQVDCRYLEPLPLVLGDEARLLQVMLNLLLNAADAMEGRGRIEVRVGRLDADPERVEIAVSDRGPGIPPEEQARIFEPFFTTKGPGQGTGLGLAISRSIVESQGGELTVESEPGRGATFAVRLRVAAPG
jgi:signal transduction histidine kinase